MEQTLIISDSQLLQLYKSGDEKAFEKLVKKYRGKVFSKIVAIVKDSEVAEDLLQETFIKAIKTINKGKYNEEGKFLPWICRIAHNLAIDYFRKGKRYPTVALDQSAPIADHVSYAQGSFEDQKIRNEAHQKVRSLIQMLPKKQRDVLLMRHFSDMSFQEIAEATNVSINTALGRMRYALINLRKQIKKYNISFDGALEAYSISA